MLAICYDQQHVVLWEATNCHDQGGGGFFHLLSDARMSYEELFTCCVLHLLWSQRICFTVLFVPLPLLRQDIRGHKFGGDSSRVYPPSIPDSPPFISAASPLSGDWQSCSLGE